ncbi:MAG: AraC family transcriptional regulator [Rhodocyclales bacterium]|nr:AraC family transcriptional regulator [Rhodocyclales bacterium]
MSRKPVHHFWRSPALPFVESRRANDSAACYAPHAHATLSLGAVDDGQSVFSRGARRQRLTRGDVVLIPAGEVHACNPEKDGRWSYQMLYLDEDWVRGVVGEMGPFDAVVLNRLPSGVAPRRIHERLTRLNACLFGEHSIEDKEATVLLFVGEIFGRAWSRALHRAPCAELAGLRDRLQDAQAMIAARCAEALPLHELAAAAGMSRYHFVRAFSRAVGMTPHAWQIDLRIRRARHLLDQGVPLAEAALQLGFSDQSHFQRAFKQRVAVTPGQYRRVGGAISFNTKS